MAQVPLATSSSTIPLGNFWYSVFLYHDRSYLINRRLGSVTQILFCEISFTSANIKHVSDAFTREALLYEIRKLPDIKSVTPAFIKSILESHDKEVLVTKSSKNCFSESFDDVFISIRILHGRRDKTKCLETVILDKKNNVATFFAVQEHDDTILAPQYPYHIELTRNGNLRIVLNSFEDADTSSAEWLASKLFPKLIKWTENKVDSDKIIYSLNLINAEEYYTLYVNLKEKYSKKLIEVWPQNAKTDPLKYVFEELAIATYLICLWRQLQLEDVNFVDCGCGNGLLVHVLNQEGYKGRGVDVRSRKLWEIFSADLKVEVVTPSSVFPDANWIIGNHSDELTPWIPVIATKSSPKTNFFVLPCCTYDFSGQKYIRVDTSKSQYNDYLDYIQEISLTCGFNTSVDRLKIPSTRRICLVGVRKNFDEIRFAKIIDQMNKFIDSRLHTQDFTARKAIEPVRNCTQIDKTLINKIIQLTVSLLLAKEKCITKANGQPWNQGGSVSLNELSQKISNEDLKSLKNESGGLQTLLKNKRYIFQVREGSVCLQKPLSLAESTKYKDKQCWFYTNHPHGCFFDDETCAYKH